MSVKRTAPNDLNHENWDKEDPSEKEEMGSFKAASQDVLEKRVMRTAKRRAPISRNEPSKSAFSGFGGFNKTQPSSFDFLANLTNGSKNASDAKSDTSVSSSLFTSKPATNTNGGLFGMPPTSSAKPAFGTGASPFASSMSAPKTEIPSMTFHSSKADSTVGDSPFKMQSVSSSNDNNAKPSTAQVSSTLFGVSSTSPNQKPSLASNILSKQPVSSSTTPVQNSPANSTTAMATPANKTTSAEKEKEVARNKYYSKLKGLNESVSSWIVKHVDITPLCFLTPIFKDYENYLQVIQEEYEAAKKKIQDKAEQELSEKQATGYKENSPFASPDPKPTSSAPQESKSATTLFGLNNTTSTTSTGLFGGTFSTNTDQSSKTSVPAKGFSFGITPSATNSPAVPAKPDNPASPSQGFSFAAVTTAATSPVGASLFSSTANTGSPAAGFSFGISTSVASSPTNTASNATGAASFSFGIAGSKPFSFSPQTQQSTVAAPEVEDEDQPPPKVEFTPVLEENSVFDKKCKIFVKKDGNFVDKGVGTLYIKKVEGNSKHQLLVRANTNLGTVLLNLILATAVPTQRMGKNNVMLVCIPTPDSKPPPTPVLIRVKTGEEADQLLETLNKYKS